MAQITTGITSASFRNGDDVAQYTGPDGAIVEHVDNGQQQAVIRGAGEISQIAGKPMTLATSPKPGPAARRSK